MRKFLALIGFITLASVIGVAQPVDSSYQSPTEIIDYDTQNEYTIGKINVEGARFTDKRAIMSISGLAENTKIRLPGPDIPKAIKNLWKIRLFTDVQVNLDKIIGDVAFITIEVTERPRLSRFSYEGAKKSQHDDLNEEVTRFAIRGGIVTDNVKKNCETGIKKYYIEKGFLDVAVDIQEIQDSVLANSVRLVFNIDKGPRIKIRDIVINGNESVSDKKIRKLMKKTKRKGAFFKSSKLVSKEFESDKRNIIGYYNTIGHRDARIVKDSIFRVKGEMVLMMDINEGNPYYFRDIEFKGNSIYSEERLKEVLGIAPGDVYNEELLQQRLSFSPDSRDVSSLYLDNGYLFFRVDPIEKSIKNDSIDLEIRITEGPQAEIDQVRLIGNDRTHDHVVIRELRTKPGEKFSRADIIRSQREILALGYFSQESLEINTPVNPARGTVDIEYVVEERPSDQLELSAGWGGRGRGVIGTLGVTFNNFSLRNLTDFKSWSPLPQGDGQRLSLRAQTNGRFFQSYNMSFTEPWLGGKKPNSFTFSAFYSRSTNGGSVDNNNFAGLAITGVSAGLGVRLKVPDDFFVSQTTLSYQRIRLDGWQGFQTEDGVVNQGSFFNISLNQTISRNSVDSPIFPTSGSRFALSLQATLPYSLFRPNANYAEMAPEDRYKWVEYHKWKFTAEWYSKVVGKLTLKLGAKIGMLGNYSSEIGTTPFERFEVGGDGISNFQGIEGKDIVALRGYDISDLEANQFGGATVFDKLTLELRYPLSLNPSATIFVLGFAEGGNAWNRFRDFNPLDLNRSVGFGLRVFLPMFGTLGFDYGFGIDKQNIPDGAGIGEYGRFSIILGFEPQ